jgi:hypothetical protein
MARKPKTRKAFIVVGCTGVEDDYDEWNVCVYFDEKKAADRVEVLNSILEKHRLRYEDGPRYGRGPDDENEARNEPGGDKYLSASFYGCRYHYVDIDFGEDF